MSPAWRRSVLLATAILAAAFESRCGARTALPLPEPCAEAGSERRCSNTCGVGQQVCRFGYWQPCAVPVASRPCSNTCGAGTESCVDDAWQACAVPVATRPCSSVCGMGMETCADDAWGACDAPLPAPPTLTATVRNIHLGQPDFHQSCCVGGVDPGIVALALGADGTPVYAGNPVTGTLTTHGQADFQSWYHDVPGVDLSTTVTLPFVPEPAQPGIDTFDNEAFFPIDNQLFGNQGNVDNEDFTLQTHAQILYTGGETYDFSSDDNLVGVPRPPARRRPRGAPPVDERQRRARRCRKGNRDHHGPDVSARHLLRQPGAAGRGAGDQHPPERPLELPVADPARFLSSA